MRHRWLGLVVFVAGMLACDGETPESDAGDPRPDATAPCADDDACDDGVFCNGEERCDPDDADADAFGCTRGEPVTCEAGQSCDETTASCAGECATPDADGDGHDSIACGGDDCDDDDDDRFPGNTESCDASHDEDCDPATLGSTDADEDGQVAAACCNGDACGSDCDDTNPAVYMGATEACNGVDDDCDGATDEGLSPASYYPDCDGDGAGALGATPMIGCTAPSAAPSCTVTLPGAGWSLSSGDCDDTSAEVGPGVTELCNGIDDNCNGSVDEGVVPTCYQDLDGDERGNPAVTASSCTCPSGFVLVGGDCDDTPGVGASIYPGATELCDGLDNNCNGALDFPGEDDDGDGFADATLCSGPLAVDCDDDDANVNPDQTEIVANGQDDDCDGEELCYVNADGDDFGTSVTVATTDIACLPSQGHASQSGDCCDSDARAYPGQTQYFGEPRSGCGGYDFNCAGGEQFEEALPYPATISSGGCFGVGTCGGATLVPGWSPSVPTSCGDSASYRSECRLQQACTPACNDYCVMSSTPYERRCH